MNIIVVLTPFQAIAAKHVIDSGILKGETRLFCFLKESEWARNLLGSEAEFLSGRNKWDGLKALWRFKKACVEIAARPEEINAVFAHPFHPATNYLLFSKWATRRYILPDGIANYYQRDVDARLRKQMLLRKLAAMIVGLPYKIYEGHIIGHETGLFDGVFAFQVKGMVTNPGQVFPMKMTGRTVDKPAPLRSVMFLDQNVEALLPSAEAAGLRQLMREVIANLEVDTVYYKGHHTISPGKKMFSGEGVVELDSGIPAELLMESISPTYVLSFISSGLINAKLIRPDVQAISVGANQIERLHQGNVQGLREMFELFEVQVL